ncbi:CPBP family intramembrane glutamic endopeptidase [Salinimicrobium gaetbulicola]|uniref:CPBP family intramembrane glutamic endopeptidase n=1 Tax=Salinimicrobium gaetbulicola TaxID=999702 RepID=A0ABW3IIR9_9FLAO
MKNFISRRIAPQEYNINQKTTLGLSLWLLLAVNFTLNYLSHTYYAEEILEITSPGFWLFWLNSIFLFAIVTFTKRAIPWSWKDLGLGRPSSWWKPVLTSVLTFGALVLFSVFVRPVIIETFGAHQNISYLETLKGNLPRLIQMLITVWVGAAFLEELVFRAYIIKSMEILLGNSFLTTTFSILVSAVFFAGIHAYQGLTGLLITGSLGIIFGIVYVLNGRRIWPLIFVHGLVDTIMLIGIYNS